MEIFNPVNISLSNIFIVGQHLKISCFKQTPCTLLKNNILFYYMSSQAILKAKYIKWKANLVDILLSRQSQKHREKSSWLE